jgi:hypothetical protein
MSRLLRGICRGMLRWTHKHNRLRGLPWLGTLMDHHWGASAWAWIPTMWLRWRWSGMLWISMSRARGVHLHLGIIGTSHSLRNPDVRAARWLLDHHRSSHSIWWTHKLWCSSRVLAYMRRLRGPLIDIKLWHWLTKRQLCMGTHR